MRQICRCKLTCRDKIDIKWCWFQSTFSKSIERASIVIENVSMSSTFSMDFDILMDFCHFQSLINILMDFCHFRSIINILIVLFDLLIENKSKSFRFYSKIEKINRILTLFFKGNLILTSGIESNFDGWNWIRQVLKFKFRWLIQFVGPNCLSLDLT